MAEKPSKEKEKKLTAEEKAAIERQELIKKLITEAAPRFVIPKEAEVPGGRPITREYREFREEAEKEKIYNNYEKVVKFFAKIAKISPSPETSAKMLETIHFSGMKVTPDEVMSASIFSMILLLVPAIFTFFLPIPGIFIILALIAPFGIAYFIYNYPASFANVMRIKTGRDLVIAVLYMIVYMKTSPNLEGAVRFAATNVSGKLADDLKEVLWKVEIGIHPTVEEALTEYVFTWRNYNKEFIEAVHLMRESLLEGLPERRDALLDKAIDVVLIGTDERMKKYARDLQMPVSVLHGLGVLLPVMGMIVFPLVSIFLAENIANLPLYLFVGYDILLPAFVYFFMKQTLDKRPGTHNTIDVTEHPDYVPISMMKVGRSVLPVWPLALVGGTVLMLPAILFMVQTNFFTALGQCPNMVDATTCSTKTFCVWEGTSCGATGVALPMSLLIVVGLAIAIVAYYYGTSFQKTKLRDKVFNIESEFEEALFALGNRLSGGTPVELAIVEAEEDTKELSISELFRISIKNIQRLGMTFRESLFDKEYGALRYYPSKLIKTIMSSLAETAEKGTRAVSQTMLTISRYLRDIHTTQEKISDLLSPTLASMRFQAYILVPAICGVVVAVSDLIMKMLAKLSATFAGISAASTGAGGLGDIPNPAEMLFGIKSATPPEILQLIVGIYVVEILVLLGIFINRIEVGEDAIKEHETVWKITLTGLIVYILVLMMVKAMFGPLIAQAATV